MANNTTFYKNKINMSIKNFTNFACSMHFRKFHKTKQKI